MVYEWNENRARKARMIEDGISGGIDRVGRDRNRNSALDAVWYVTFAICTPSAASAP